MEILVINLNECYLERVSLTPEEEKHLETQDDYCDYHEIAESILKNRGYDTNDISITWMIADDVPVFEYGESIPFFTI